MLVSYLMLVGDQCSSMCSSVETPTSLLLRVMLQQMIIHQLLKFEGKSSQVGLSVGPLFTVPLLQLSNYLLGTCWKESTEIRGMDLLI